jgi:ABC-type lipoprotein export system ATPase subunit
MIELDTFFQLQGITLKLQPGSKVALVGPSGGGKVPFLSFFSILLRNKLSSYAASVFIQKIPIGVLID